MTRGHPAHLPADALAHHNQQPEKTPVGKHQKAERCAQTVTHSAKHYQFR